MKITTGFWAWYERHHKLNTAITAALFTLQLVHLYWLTTEVVMERISGESFFPHTNALAHFLLIFVDYTEIPALISTTILYIHLYRKDKRFKHILYLFFINIQFLHIFWITDEFVVGAFAGGSALAWNPILAWIAISIDYLELPVIFETIKEAVKNYFPKFFDKSKSD